MQRRPRLPAHPGSTRQTTDGTTPQTASPIRRPNMKKTFAAALLPALIALAYAGSAAAQIKVGVSVSATGPAASLGIPEKNTIALLPKTIAGKTVEYIVLDDATDPTTAVKNARKLVS